MADGITKVSDMIVPEHFVQYIQDRTEEKSRIITSGVAVRSSFLDDFLADSGLTIYLPGFRDLDNDDERVSDDSSSTTATHHRIQTRKEVAVRLSRNNSWSASDMAADLSGADPMLAIQNRVGDYWIRRLQRMFIATSRGVFADSNENDSNDLTFDVSGSSYTRGLTDFSAEAFVDATATMGDSQDDLGMICVHSMVYAKMKKNNMIDFVPDSEQRINIPVFLNHRVIVDDGLNPTATGGGTGVYDSWLFAPGAYELGMGSPKNPVEMDREPGAGNGAGEDVLYNRLEWCLHPVGYEYTGASVGKARGTVDTNAGGGPSNVTLQAAASWNRVFTERKQIKIARLRTRES